MIEAEFVFGSLKAVFDRPAVAFHGDEGLDVRASRAPGREEGEVAVADIPADQKTAVQSPD